MTFALKVTLFRIISVPFFIAALLFYSPGKEYLKFVALGIFLLAIVSDIIDGYVARRHRQKTRAGALLDPLADKILLLTAFIFIYRLSKAYFSVSLPLWVLLTVISRDVIILLGSGLLLAANHETPIKPTKWGKATTFFQMMTIVAVLLELRFSPLLWWMASAFTVISGIDYARKGINALNNQEHLANHGKTVARNPR
jgi:CDP-diacylglycerol--glycerol-3-phosphate 3-phosphatidyltransferase